MKKTYRYHLYPMMSKSRRSFESLGLLPPACLSSVAHYYAGKREINLLNPVNIQEDQILLQYYGKIPFKQISTFLPGKSRSAVKGRARHLGLKGDVAIVMPPGKKVHAE